MAAQKGEGNGHTVVSLADLLALPVPFEDVPVPEFGANHALRLNAVTGLERKRLSAGLSRDMDQTAKLQFQLDLIASSIGGDTTADEVGKLPAEVIDRLSLVASRLAGTEPAAVEEAEAALKTTPNGDSG